MVCDALVLKAFSLSFLVLESAMAVENRVLVLRPKRRSLPGKEGMIGHTSQVLAVCQVPHLCALRCS